MKSLVEWFLGVFSARSYQNHSHSEVSDYLTLLERTQWISEEILKRIVGMGVYKSPGWDYFLPRVAKEIKKRGIFSPHHHFYGSISRNWKNTSELKGS